MTKSTIELLVSLANKYHQEKMAQANLVTNNQLLNLEKRGKFACK